MFPKYTALTVITILGLCLSFVWYGSYSLKKEMAELEASGFSLIYSVAEVTLTDSGNYDTFILENGQVISATQQNINHYRLQRPVNKIKPSRTDPSTFSHHIYKKMLKE
ncbi:hypothetical protein ACWN8P_06005 [Vagococcus salmoninarum]|uniref:Uncharacterized protein n=1 Tax=Vagococcus salmoninarum TaxID=2739 RepID=A0A429ZQ11_9ENTE|nr:hypothetical protein [Vagococcus salmoninarum]RST95765.1 hypothetical protein CBF35_07295 [Vagococcus salmoninarum]